MASVFHFLRLGVAVVCAVAAAVCLFVAVPMVMPLAFTSVAFSLLPEA